MTVQSPPYALQNGSHSAALFRQASTSLVPQSGICLPAELKVTGTGAMSVSVAAGRAWVPGSAVSNVSGQVFSVQGDYFVLNDAPVTVTVATSDPTNPRIDSVYVAVNDAFYSGSLNTAVVGVVTGTPAVSPVAPPIPTNALLLATVAVAANATTISSGNVTDRRAYAMFGTLNLPGATAVAPTVAPGTSVYDPTADRFGIATATGWRTFVPVSYAALTDSTSRGMANATWQQCVFASAEVGGQGTDLSTTITGLNVLTTGIYSVSAIFVWASNTTGYRGISVGTAGPSNYLMIEPALAGSNNHPQSYAQDIPFNAGDVISLYGFQSSTAALNLVGYRHLTARKVG